MVWALGLAATQSAGLREMFGSMGKAFHPGRSAQNGYAAALLAQAGFTSGERGIEGPRGFCACARRDRAICRRSPPDSASISICARTPTSRSRAASSITRPSTARFRSTTSIVPIQLPSSPSGFGSRRWCSTCATSRTSRKDCRASSPCITARRSDWCAARAVCASTPTKR